MSGSTLADTSMTVPGVAEETSRPTAPAWWSGPVAVTVPTVLVVLHAALYGWWVVDDAAITWAYARSFAQGAGPVLQPGGPAAEGWSNPTWLAVFVIVTWLGVPLVMAAKALGLVCCVVMFGAMVSVARAAAVPRPELVACAAATVTAATPSFVIWSFSGLENPLYAAVVAWLVAVVVRAPLLARRTACLAGVLAALAALTRPDGLVYLAVLPVAAIAVHRRRGVVAAATSTAVAVALVTSYGAWRWHRFGLLVPNTAVAKGQGAPTLDPLIEAAPSAAPLLAAAALAGIFGAVRCPTSRRALGVVMLALVLALGAYAVLAQDWMGMLRFATPVWPLVAIVLCLGVSTAGSALIAAVGVLAIALSLMVWVPAARAFRAAPPMPACQVAAINGSKIDGYADRLGIRSGSLLVPDVGGPALVGRLEVVDLAGLAEPRMAGFYSSGDMAGLRDYIFGQLRPTFVKAHGRWAQATGVLSDQRLSAAYVLLDDSRTGAVWVRRDATTMDRVAQTREGVGSARAAESAELRAPRKYCWL